MPKFWLDNGQLIEVETNGCMASDLDQYGDMEAFGVHPDWQRQLAKFASVQDRLREWDPSVMAKLKVFACMAIKALDLDAIRIDKATQVTVDALADWASSARACAAALGKNNFFIPGEVTGGDTFGALYMYVICVERLECVLTVFEVAVVERPPCFHRVSWPQPTCLIL